MGRSGMIWAASLGGLLLVFVVDSAGIGQSPRAVNPRQPAPQEGGAVPFSPPSPAANQPRTVTPLAVAEGMLGFASPDAVGGQMVTLVDSRQNWMAVYAVDSKGQIRLLSSRPLQQDFSVQFNVTDPTPAEIGRLKPR